MNSNHCRLALRSRAYCIGKITAWFSLLIIGAGVMRVGAQPSAIPDQKFWMPNGPINAILATSNTVYLGGDFSYIGPRTGPMAVFDATTGQLLTGLSRIGGLVKAVVSDGASGWYIGGTFTNIAGVAITNLAHLDSHLALDPSFNAKVTGTAVNALLLDSGGRLYIAGSFTRVNGTLNSGGLFGVKASDGTLVWNPQLTGTVNALAMDSTGLLYAGGNFSSVGSSNIANLAAIATNAAALATAWSPAPDAQVNALWISGTNIYVGGQFANIGPVGNVKARNRLAALSLATGIAGTWNPNPNGIVRALWVTATNAYVGGDFTTIAVASRRGFASIGLTGAGSALSLDLQAQSAGTLNLVRSILLAGNSLYIGGNFTNFLGTQSSVLAAVDITANSSITNVPIGSDFNGSSTAPFGANAMAVSGNKVAVVGDFQSLGGVARKGAAALSIAAGGALPWSPVFQGGPVESMALGTNVIYVGGSFTNLNGSNVEGLAAVDMTVGNATAFTFGGSNGVNPTAVNSLLFAPGSGLFVGGAFTTVSSQPRRLLALVDPVTGALNVGFNASFGGGGTLGVTSMVLDRTNLYVCGDFTTINSVSQPRLADLSALDGSRISSWQPLPNSAVSVLTASADTLYIGGTFSQVQGSIALKNFAAFSLADQSLVPIDATLPTTATGVTGLGATTTVIYLGGTFSAAGGELRTNLAAIAPADGSAIAWGPPMDAGPSVITVTDGYAYMGGAFRQVGNQNLGFFAPFSRTPQFTSAAQIDPVTLQFSLITGDRTDVVLQWTSDLKSGVWSNIATNSPYFPWTFQLPFSDGQGYLRAVAR